MPGLGTLIGFLAHLCSFGIQGLIDSQKAKLAYQSKQLDMQIEAQRDAHELLMIQATATIQLQEKTMEMQSAAQLAQIGQIRDLNNSQATMAGMASKCFLNLSASVRPVITYLFTFVFLFLLCEAIRQGYKTNGLTISMIRNLFDIEFISSMELLFESMIAFWFGDRAANKARNSK